MKENRRVIENKTFDEERALYHLSNTDVIGCVFAGAQDGESVLKEGRGLLVKDCAFALRYPLWHDKVFRLENSRFEETSRAALWYCWDGEIKNCDLNGIKALRECTNVTIDQCRVVSEEFGWKCRDILITDSSVQSEYLFLDSRNIRLQRIRMKGKYSFQYIEGLEIENSVLDTKDAFWHCKNVIVKNSIVKGEYLGWYSENLTLVNCEIEGTQPLCYCKNLRLIHCRMKHCDLAFEYSDVEADIIGSVDSVKNPLSGVITADEVGEIIFGDAARECTGRVMIRDAKQQ